MRVTQKFVSYALKHRHGHVERFEGLNPHIETLICQDKDKPVTSRKARELGLSGRLQTFVRQGNSVYVRRYENGIRFDRYFVRTSQGINMVEVIYS